MTSTRRAALAATATGIAGLASVGTSAGADRTQRPRLPELDGELRFDDATREAAAGDFGRLRHRLPRAVLLPASAADVAATLRWAGERGLRVAPRGAGHSVFGRALARDGIVADLRRLRDVHAVESDHAVVDAGATWAEVLAATLPRGLAPPVLTDHLGPSVGGTLVVGGVGATTSRLGVQSDHVLELEVVTGAGERVTCSRTRHATLFDAVRAGLGQVAIVTRATLRLTPAAPSVRRFALHYRDLPGLVADARRLAADGRFDAVQGALTPTGTGWTYRLDAVKHLTTTPPDDDALLAGLTDDRAQAERATLPYAAYLERLNALEQALRANGQWDLPHPWLTTFVGDAAVDAVVAGELAALPAADLGPFGQVVLSPVRRRAVRTPLLRLPADDLAWAFNLVRIPATGDRATARRLVRANRAAYERIHAAGGTLYPVSAFPMTRGAWRRHFGPAFGDLRAARRRFDPHGVLTPGYEVFG